MWQQKRSLVHHKWKQYRMLETLPPVETATNPLASLQTEAIGTPTEHSTSGTPTNCDTSDTVNNGDIKKAADSSMEVVKDTR